MSEHRIEIVPVKLERHPNADTLSIVRVRGYQVIVRTEDWLGQDMGVYVPPDYVVPPLPSLEFLRGVCRTAWGRLKDIESPNDWMQGWRIKTKKFRGEWSQGLLLPVGAVWEAVNTRKHEGRIPPEVLGNLRLEVGEDVMRVMEIGRYEVRHEERTFKGEEVSPPTLPIPVYDVESFFEHPDMLVPGEDVIVTEKIHGTNARFVFHDGQFFVGSHRTWKKEDPNSVYWRVLNGTPENGAGSLKLFLREHPDTVLFGEIYGDGVQDLTYGFRKGSGDKAIRFFDAMGPDGQYEDIYGDTPLRHALLEYGLLCVPVVGRVPFSVPKLMELAVGKSLIAPEQIREGIVVRPVAMRNDAHIGRVVLKLVSNEYLERQ
jgi:RNA ligase (TIGR02306 family)